MRKYCWIILLVFASVWQIAQAQQVREDEIWYTTSDNSQFVVTNTYEFDGAQIVSNTYKDYYNCWVIKFDKALSGIGRFSFYKSKVTSVRLPNNTLRIYRYAFAQCPNLTYFDLPDVKLIDECAFRESGLTYIIMPRSLTTLGIGAFRDCKDLAKVVIASNSIEAIPQDAFRGCTSLKEITIPKGVSAIESDAFNGCSSLSSLTIEGAPSIEYRAFIGCTNLKTITMTSLTPPANCLFPSDVRGVTLRVPEGSEAAYADAYPWREFKIETYDLNPDMIYYTTTDAKTIEPYAKEFGAQLRSNFMSEGVGNLVFDNDVTMIGARAFYNCWRLTTITMPGTVTSIGDKAFSSCGSLKSVNIPKKVTTLGREAFSSCYSLTSVNFAGSLIDKIRAETFYYCTDLTSINLPESLTEIEQYAFYNCSSLKSVTIPQNVMVLGNNAFMSCRLLNSVTFEGSLLKKMPEEAFYKCENLTSINLPESLTEIESSAFKECRALESITIPQNVRTLGWSVFNGCPLRSFTVEAKEPPTVSSYTFTGLEQGKCTLYVPAGSKQKYMNAQYWKDFYNIVEIGADPKNYVDCNHDGVVNSADVVTVYNYIVGGGTNKDDVDCNGDGLVNSADVVAIYNYIQTGANPRQ